MNRYRMGSYEDGGSTFTCSRGHLWPPMKVIAYGPTAEDARPHVTPEDYQRIRAWETACGLREMNPEKCAKCPYVEKDGKLVTAPGIGGIFPQHMGQRRKGFIRR